MLIGLMNLFCNKCMMQDLDMIEYNSADFVFVVQVSLGIPQINLFMYADGSSPYRE